MKCQKFLPESMYVIDSEMNLGKVALAMKYGKSITGRVVRLNCINEYLEVDIGNQFIGILPFKSATIYPIVKKDSLLLSPNIYTLVGKKIRLKVTGFLNGQIFLDRKQSMQEALDSLTEECCDLFLTTTITGFSHDSAFVDVGGGIAGKIYAADFSSIFFRDIKDIEYQLGDKITCSIINFDYIEQKFNLNRTDCLPDVREALHPKDIVVCKVFEKVLNNPVGIGNGYYVLINKNYAGILDSGNISLEYGQIVVGFIRKFNEKGPKLSFLETVKE